MNLTVNFSGDKELSPYLRMLVAGAPGVGKTRFALTAPSPLFANCMGGLTTLAVAEHIPYVNIGGEQDLLNLKAALTGTYDELVERFSFPVETLVVDTVDEFQRLLLIEKLKQSRKEETGPGDWQWLGQRCHAIFEALAELPLNIILLVHTKQENDGESFWLKPGLQGAFTDQINQYVDVAALLRANTYYPAPQPETWTYPQITWTDGVSGIVSGDEGQTYTLTNTTNTIDITTTTPAFTEDRYLVTKPTLEYEWLKDYTNTLPPIFELNFEDDFKRILELRKLSLPESVSLEYDLDVEAPVLKRDTGYTIKKPARKTTKKAAALPVDQLVGQTTTTKCESCDKLIETQDWVDLSYLKHGQKLCKTCCTQKG